MHKETAVGESDLIQCNIVSERRDRREKAYMTTIQDNLEKILSLIITVFMTGFDSIKTVQNLVQNDLNFFPF